MTTNLVALFILSSALVVFSRDQLPAATYALVLDAPEKGQGFDQQAKQAMSELVLGKDVVLQPHTIDRSGRLVARVLVGGQDAGLELLKQGLCWVYEKYVGEASALVQARYRNAQDAAQAQKAGLWRDPDPVPPWEWGKSEKERSKTAQDAI